MSILAAVLATSLVPAMAEAQERTGDAALGALSGAVVLGPVGALAGAVIGYTQGPEISRAWGLRGSSSQRRSKSARRPDGRPDDGAVPRKVARADRTVPAAAPARADTSPPDRPAPGASTVPVQGFD